MTKFAERLKELRNEKGLSQAKLAELTGIGQTAISEYELKEKTPSIDVLYIFCNFFKISADYLIGLVD